MGFGAYARRRGIGYEDSPTGANVKIARRNPLDTKSFRGPPRGGESRRPRTISYRPDGVLVSGSSMPRSMFGILVLVAVVGAMVPAAALARSKTDLVYLKNGDRLTGEIKELDRGILKLSTDAISTIGIEWADVDSLNSVYQFRVESSYGYKYFGSIFMRHDGMVEVVGAGRTQELAASMVIAIVPLEASFWQQLDGSISLGFSYAKSDKLAQLTLNGWVQRRTTIRQTRLDAATTVTSTEQSDIRVRYDFSLDHRRLLQRILFVEGTGGVQRNDELGLKLRTSLLGGLGANFLQTNRTVLLAGAGLAVNHEWAADGSETTNLEAQIGAEHAIFTYNTPKTDYSTQVVLYPSLSNWGRVRLDLNIHARREVIKDLFLELSYYLNYDNQPPGGGTTTDYGLVFSFGYTF